MNSIKIRREKRGLSQAELAALAGINLRTLKALEQNYRSLEKAQLITALKLADALDVTVYDLIET